MRETHLILTLLLLLHSLLALVHLYWYMVNVCWESQRQTFHRLFVHFHILTSVCNTVFSVQRKYVLSAHIFQKMISYSCSQIPEEHDLESQVRMERQWRFLRNTRVRRQSRAITQRGRWHTHIFRSACFPLLLPTYRRTYLTALFDQNPWTGRTEPGVPFRCRTHLHTY